MAEVVEAHKERALAQYEQMQMLDLFTPEEIGKIKTKREYFEYAIAQRSKDLKSFVEYIKYERNLVALTKKRTNDRRPEAAHNIMTLIASHIKELYDQGLSKFPANARFWDEYVKFLEQFNFKQNISPTYDKMLQFHSDKPDIWIRVILYEYNAGADNERVKGLMLRAQQLHPESQKILTTFFQMELDNKRQVDPNLALQHATVVYTNGKKKFPKNFEFFHEMLKTTDNYEYAAPIQKTIIDDMCEIFRLDEILWQTLAQRELDGLSTSDFREHMQKYSNEDAIDYHVDGADDNFKAPLDTITVEESAPECERKRIENAVQIFEVAVKVVDTAKMWASYLDTMITMKSDLSTLSSLKRYALYRAFEAANRSHKMSERHYLQYVELLYTKNPNSANVERVLQEALQVHSKSLEIWYQLARYYIRCNSFKRLQEVFIAARQRLGGNCAEVWYLYLMFLRTQQTAETNTEFEKIVVELATQSHPTFGPLKGDILEHIAVTSNIKRARKMYNLFSKHSPNSFEIYDTMADLESKQLNHMPELERRCYQLMRLHFGRTRADVWIRSIRFELKYGDPKFATKLYHEAMNELHAADARNEFKRKYNSLLNSSA